MFFDSHCHLDRIDLADFDDDFDVLLQACAEQQVSEMVCIGVNLETFDAMQRKVGGRDHIHTTVGVHPDYEQARETTVDELVRLSRQPGVVAIGETGLDYYHTEGPEWQRQRFRTHIDAALEADKPLVIHTRQARDDTLAILREHGAERVGGVLHCFTEDWDMAVEAIDMGFYVSISGIVTFKQADNVREVAARIPDDRLLVETDSPWLAPVPYRGKPNFPGHVRLVADKLAEVRGVSLEHIAEVTARNARTLFGLGA